METSKVTSKGQIVIPSRIRKRFGMKPGARIAFIEKKGEVYIKPFDKEYYENFAGILEGKGNLLDELMREKEYEKNL